MSIKVGNLDLTQYAVQTRQALDAYKANRPAAQEVPDNRNQAEMKPVDSSDLSTVLSDDERQALYAAFGGRSETDTSFMRRTNALILKGSRIDLTI
jgi:hypothetical protein